MVSFRTLVVTFGLFCGVFGQSNGTTTTSAPATSSSAVVVSAATIDDISNSTVVDPSDVEDLFSGLVGVSNSTNSTLVVERSNTNCKCSYGMSCWPADVAWDLLNLTLSGRLIKYIPAAAPCHNTFNGLNTYNADQCSVVTTGWTTEEFHLADPASTVWEFRTNMSCQPTTDPTTSCTRGNYPVYVINATTPGHIQIGVIFARLFNIRLIIKNTGHDFLGKSLGYGSLSIWTHQFQDVNFISKYSGPGGYTGTAVQLGAGVNTRDIYQMADAQGVIIRVGFSGGYIQGGGHGPHTPTLGMAADQALSFDIVLASGLFVTATPTSYTDLFWAVMGGGGSTFGVVTSVTVKTFPGSTYTGAVIQFGAGENQTTFWNGVGAFHENAATFAENDLYAYYEVSNLGSRLFNLKPLFGRGKTVAEMNDIIAPFLAALDGYGIQYTCNVTNWPSFWTAYNALFDPEVVGYDFLFGSRLFSKSDMTTKVDEVTLALEYVVETGGYVIVSHIVAPGQANNTYNNAVNPFWRSNVLFPIVSTFLSADMTAAETTAALDAHTNNYVARLRNVTPSWGTYLNEADFNEPNFQSSFYGSSYSRLLSIKNTYDPSGLFYAKTAVGSEAWVEESNGQICAA